MDAIVVDNVSKSFRIATNPADSLKERLVRFRRGHFEEFVALQPLDLAIKQGESVGILGHNGSGKSTLLKCIAGILTPSTGEVRVRGRLASLLELGTGFHPDLTGRDNVYINTSFYGMSRREVDRVFDDIVEFADMSQFIDEPVKHYSSGMYVRLGFAVAVHLDPEVLLVDEVLAVGDESFQAKCIARIQRFQEEGRTIVFVTHDVEAARKVCNRGIVLNHGAVVLDDEPGKAIRVLREYLHGPSVAGDVTQVAETAATITDVRVTHAHVHERAHLQPGESFTVEVDVACTEPVTSPVLNIELGDRSGNPIFNVSTDDLGTPLPKLDARHTLKVHVKDVRLLDGEWAVNLILSDHTSGRVLDWRQGPATFSIVNSTKATGLVDLDVHVEAETIERGEPR